MEDNETYRILDSLDPLVNIHKELEKIFNGFPIRIPLKKVVYPYKIIGKAVFAKKIIEKTGIQYNRYDDVFTKFIPSFTTLFNQYSIAYPRQVLWELTNLRTSHDNRLEGYIQQAHEKDPNCIDEIDELEWGFFWLRDDIGYIMMGIEYLEHDNIIPLYNRYVIKMQELDSDFKKYLPDIRAFYNQNKWIEKDNPNFYPSHFFWRRYD